MPRGTVVSLSRNYGFIAPADGGGDVYFMTESIRWAGLEFIVQKGTEVEYVLHPLPDGKRTAREIKPIVTRAELDDFRSARWRA